ncbi:hypothetical protein [Armatimonas sp.]|uniref:hypothetical protein n=1 Tax=Armatimonas sp. TaxID=1872638 RepID=UPI0037535225
MIVSTIVALATFVSVPLNTNSSARRFWGSPSFTVAHLPYVSPHPASNKNKDEMAVSGCSGANPAAWTVNLDAQTTVALLNDDPISKQVWAETGNPSGPKIIHLPTEMSGLGGSNGFHYRYIFHWTRNNEGMQEEGTTYSPSATSHYTTAP